MIHHCKITPIKVFISSSMKGNENSIYNQRRKAIRSFFNRWEYFEAYFFENTAGTSSPDEEMERNIKECDLIIMVLDKSIADRRKGVVIKEYSGVEKEYRFCNTYRKKPLTFVCRSDKDSLPKDLLDDIKRKYKYTEFNDTEELIDKIEDSIIKEMLYFYRRSLLDLRLLEEDEPDTRSEKSLEFREQKDIQS